MFCQKCGKENPDDAAFCNSCGVGLNQIPGQTESSKHNKIIDAKIATKEGEINTISQIGPALVGIIGIIVGLLLFGFIGVIIGIILILFAIWWYSKKENAKKKLQSEIKELEAELE